MRSNPGSTLPVPRIQQPPQVNSPN
jgi:hypothetical protein